MLRHLDDDPSSGFPVGRLTKFLVAKFSVLVGKLSLPSFLSSHFMTKVTR